MIRSAATTVCIVWFTSETMGATDRTRARARARRRGDARDDARARPEREEDKKMSPASSRAPSGDGRAWTRPDAADGVDGVERPRSAERRRPTTTDARATGTGVDVRAERCGLDAVERSDGDGDGAADGAEGAGGDDAGR